jgi:hypothetical protein
VLLAAYERARKRREKYEQELAGHEKKYGKAKKKPAG